MAIEGGPTFRICVVCSGLINFGNSNRIFCSNRCKKADYNKRNRELVKSRQRDRNKTDSARQSREKYRKSQRNVDRLAKIAEYNATMKEMKKERTERRKLEAWVWSMDRLTPKPCYSCAVIFSPSATGQIYCCDQCRATAKDKSKARKNEYERRLRMLQPDAVRKRELERERKRAAIRAISTLILPVSKTEEKKQ